MAKHKSKVFKDVEIFYEINPDTDNETQDF